MNRRRPGPTARETRVGFQFGGDAFGRRGRRGAADRRRRRRRRRRRIDAGDAARQDVVAVVAAARKGQEHQAQVQPEPRAHRRANRRPSPRRARQRWASSPNLLHFYFFFWKIIPYDVNFFLGPMFLFLRVRFFVSQSQSLLRLFRFFLPQHEAVVFDVFDSFLLVFF